jgi:hypothetical protein
MAHLVIRFIKKWPILPIHALHVSKALLKKKIGKINERDWGN